MLMTKKSGRRFGRCGWAISVLQAAEAIRECEEHAGRRTAPPPMRASAPSTSSAGIRRRGSPRGRRP